MTKFLPLAAALLLLFFGITLYVFLCAEISRTVSVAAAARANASGAGQQELFQQSVQSFVNDTAVQRAELATFIAKDTDIVSLIDTIDNAAKREKVSVTIGAVNVVAGSWQHHEPLEVTLSAQGSFAQLAAFATDLESLPMASRLLSMNAEASENHLWFDTFVVQFVKEKAP